MGRRVNITDLARATHTSTSSWRTWLEQPGFPLSIEYGGYRGGTSEQRGRVRYLDFDEAVAWLNKRGGAQVEESVLPHEQLELLRAEITALNRRVQRLEELLLSGGYRPSLASRAAPLGEHQRQHHEQHDLHDLHDTRIDEDDLDDDDDDAPPTPAAYAYTPTPMRRVASPGTKWTPKRSDKPPLPAHLRTWRSVADEHDVPHRTLRAQHEIGVIRVVREPSGQGWKIPHGHVKEAYDDDALDDFHSVNHDRLGVPCSVCGYVPRALRGSASPDSN